MNALQPTISSSVKKRSKHISQRWEMGLSLISNLDTVTLMICSDRDDERRGSLAELSQPQPHPIATRSHTRSAVHLLKLYRASSSKINHTLVRDDTGQDKTRHETVTHIFPRGRCTTVARAKSHPIGLTNLCFCSEHQLRRFFPSPKSLPNSMW